MNTGTIKKEQVVEWIRAIGSTPVEVRDPDTEWHLEMDYPSRSTERVHVLQPKGRPFQLVIATGLNVSPNHVKAFDELPPDEQEEFSFGLLREITRPEVDYQLEGSQGPHECPSLIQISRSRYADGLTLDSFSESIGFVFKTKRLAVYHFQRLNESGATGGGRFDFKRAGL